MARAYYIREEKSGSPVLRRLLILLIVLALLGSTAVGLFIYTSDQNASKILSEFKSALEGQDFAAAIGLYRQTQEKALASGFLDRNQAKYQASLTEMEILANQRIQEMQDQLLASGRLTNAELAFAEDMAEVSAVRLITFLRSLCRDYLLGKIERKTMESAFDQLASLKNLSDAVSYLPGEFDRMAAAQPQIMAALESLGQDDYWPAYDGLAAIISNDEFTGYVHEQASLLLDECKGIIYEPLLEMARDQMEGGRYLSAQAALLQLQSVFPDDEAIGEELAFCAIRVPETLIEYYGPIEVISIKPLIINAALAFDGDAYSQAAADSMLTAGEFSAMLEQLYANNYILVDSSKIYTADRKLNQLLLPAGKKPLVLVLEGLNYYASRRATGNCWDLVLDEGGEVCAEYPDSSGQMVIDRQGEAIGLLDLFVKAHPDFSLDGAKGTISLTGYECIFGAITDADQLDDRNKALLDNGMAGISLTEDEIAENYQRVAEIIERLKTTGWLFASSTYGFIDARNLELEKIQADTRKWLNQVGALTGEVTFLNYPNGSFLNGSDPRSIWLQEQGFILFGGLGTTTYLYTGNNYIYIDKTPVNGFSMRNKETYHLDRLFDVSKVYDQAARP